MVDKSLELKNKFTTAVDAPTDFATIFCQEKNELKGRDKEAKSLGKVVQDSPTGFVYLLHEPLTTKAGPLWLVKVRKPDPAR
ncbi:hypothetical protein HY440_00435 [Candidatus Microgenomates bacterium]|nr:hypothetical protein [Candidatus Microgenomates bacterium]